ncbi:hypothetical protein [Brevundimonas naejangsanensis]|uniref:hypothetical protein n=1 Tax=Brevundimonas naejangsanensis TaxID=588932 RepID=UPI0026EE2B09|nr:hypothetical protein [Brevundimonas naejangsanensis]
MTRTLTIAALLPALGAATAAWAQPVPPQQAPGQTPYPAPSHARQLSWPGRPAAHPTNQPAPDWTRAPADSFAPPQQVVADSPTYAARPPIIPHGGYSWRPYTPPAVDDGRQPSPTPEFRPVTSHPDAAWRPYVSPPAETPAPDFTPPPPYQPSYQPPPWPHRPTQSQPAPYAPQPAPAPIERAPAPSQTPWSRSQPEPAPAPPVQHTPLPQPTPAPRPEPLRPMQTPPVQPAPRVVEPAPQPAAEPTPEPVRQPPQTLIAEPQPAPPPPPVQPEPQPQPQAQPEPGPAPAQPTVDPLAPRRDALIFQLQRNAPQAPAASAPASPEAPAQQPAQTAPRPASQPASNDAPAQGSARYYSVHRQAGRQPDATPLPAPNYLDALPVELDQPIASDDLAQPPEAPAVMRDAQGRLRAAPMTDGPDLP